MGNCHKRSITRTASYADASASLCLLQTTEGRKLGRTVSRVGEVWNLVTELWVIARPYSLLRPFTELRRSLCVRACGGERSRPGRAEALARSPGMPTGSSPRRGTEGSGLPWGNPMAQELPAPTNPADLEHMAGRRGRTEGNMSAGAGVNSRTSTWATGPIALFAVIVSLLSAAGVLGFGAAGLRSNETAASV